jgi:zinc transport system substrate-binding protein
LTPSNARKLAGAEIVFWAGPELEIFLEGPLRTLSTQAEIHAFSQSPELVTLAVREGGLWDEHEHGDEGGHDEAAIDAHFWLDPRNGTVIAREAARILGESDPERAALYAQNAERLAGRLTALDAQLEANLGAASGIPYVVFHDAYQYFEARYRLSPAGSVSVAADRPAGTRRIVEIRARIAEADVKCVFAPPQFPPRLIVTLIENAAARSAVLDEFGTAIDAGPELYETLLTQLADDFLSCLAP